MAVMKSTPTICRRLKEVLHHPDNARQLRRAQALLWWHEGESVTHIAHRLGVTRQAVYHVLRAFQARQDEPIARRLLDKARSGRPPTQAQAVTDVLQQVFTRSPREFGYVTPSWTAPLLRVHLWRTRHIRVHERTVRRVLQHRGYRYKRPRYVLARRSPTWCQAKGGSNAA